MSKSIFKIEQTLCSGSLAVLKRSVVFNMQYKAISDLKLGISKKLSPIMSFHLKFQKLEIEDSFFELLC